MEEIKKNHCSHCGGDMVHLATETLEIVGGMSLLYSGPLRGGLTVEIWECPQCRHLDFYRLDPREEDPVASYIDEHAEEIRKRQTEAMEVANNPGAYLQQQKLQKEKKKEEQDASGLSESEPSYWHPFRRKKKNDGDLW